MIETNKLCKRHGKLQALKGMSMTAGEGDIYGFIGPNGTGKSTTC